MSKFTTAVTLHLYVDGQEVLDLPFTDGLEAQDFGDDWIAARYREEAEALIKSRAVHPAGKRRLVET